jgi:hypothetical protein
MCVAPSDVVDVVVRVTAVAARGVVTVARVVSVSPAVTVVTVVTVATVERQHRSASLSQVYYTAEPETDYLDGTVVAIVQVHTGSLHGVNVRVASV